MAAAMWLAACELDPDAPPPAVGGGAGQGAPVDWDAWWGAKRRAGRVNFANWPYYIDFRKGRRPSLDLFTQETSIRVNYFHTIDGNESFMREIEPYLEAGLPPFYDVIVMTNGPQVSKLVNSGYLTPLDRSRLVNFDQHASDLVRDPAWDPGNRFSVAWQSGLTGIAYRPEAREALGRPPSSIGDLFDPALEGRVGMMSDLQDLGSAGLGAGGRSTS
jgi:spermidine/putrescine transport system substrate-binding protein